MTKFKLKSFFIPLLAVIFLSVFINLSRVEDDDYESEAEDRPAVVPTVSSVTIGSSVALTPLKDSDQDGIRDISDRHPGEDDFSYLLLDNNHNGIADDLELLIK